MIKAIETRYAGRRFRSRLEARWAVALDVLGVKWEYEAQGFMCTHRVSLRNQEPFPYLPDFWLPKEKCFVEVKGALTATEHLEVIDRAASLCNRTDTRLILAGPIPDPRKPHPPTAMTMRKGCVYTSPGLVGGVTQDGSWVGAYETEGLCIAHDTGGDAKRVMEEAYICHGQPAAWRYAQDPFGSPIVWDGANAFTSTVNRNALEMAYRAARSARFEHGERG